MNPIETTGNDFTRRDFMKKSALTVGAITLLGQGIGLADGTGSGSGECKEDCHHFTPDNGPGGYIGPTVKFTDEAGQTVYFKQGTCYCINGHSATSWSRTVYNGLAATATPVGIEHKTVHNFHTGN